MKAHEAVEQARYAGYTLKVPGEACCLLAYAENTFVVLNIATEGDERLKKQLYQLRRLYGHAIVSREGPDDPIDFDWY